MEHLKLVLWAIAALFITVNTWAQTTPDFSGRWTSAPETNSPPQPRAGEMGSGWGANLTLAQAANQLTVTYEFFARGDMQPPLKFIYALDGSETKNSVMMGRGLQVQTSKTAWEGDKLVITTTHSFDNPANGQPQKIEVKQTLSLTSPTTLLVETTRSGALGGAPVTTRTIYKKS